MAPRKQRELAAALGAQVFEVPLGHLDLNTKADRYNPALLRALTAVSSAEPAAVA